MDPFFAIKSKNTETDTPVYSIELNAEHPVYVGHFPDMAVAPGVMLTDIVRVLLEDHNNKEYEMIAANNLKFLRPVLPKENTAFEVTLKINSEENVKVQAVCKNGEDTYFKVSAEFSEIA